MIEVDGHPVILSGRPPAIPKHRLRSQSSTRGSDPGTAKARPAVVGHIVSTAAAGCGSPPQERAVQGADNIRTFLGEPVEWTVWQDEPALTVRPGAVARPGQEVLQAFRRLRQASAPPVAHRAQGLVYGGAAGGGL